MSRGAEFISWCIVMCFWVFGGFRVFVEVRGSTRLRYGVGSEFAVRFEVRLF